MKAEPFVQGQGREVATAQFQKAATHPLFRQIAQSMRHKLRPYPLAPVLAGNRNFKQLSLPGAAPAADKAAHQTRNGCLGNKLPAGFLSMLTSQLPGSPGRGILGFYDSHRLKISSGHGPNGKIETNIQEARLKVRS
jgi:hypothetical protein